MDKTIVVIAEHFQSKIAPVTFELLSCALDLQEHGQFPIKPVILGNDVEGAGRPIGGDHGPGCDSRKGGEPALL